jgi:hypothetical protein
MKLFEKAYSFYNNIKGDTITDYEYTYNRFVATFGYIPDFKNPQTLNEKIHWRKLYDHKRIYKVFADKIDSKDFVRNICGDGIIPKVLQVTNKTEAIDYSRLPNSFIIKATHGSGWNMVVRNKDKQDRTEISNFFDPILKESYYKRGREWCYKGLKPMLVIEELLQDENSNLPIDYKFFCFSGKVKFIQLDFDRFENHKRILLDRELNPIDLSYAFPTFKEVFTTPDNLEDMIEIAEKISKSLDFIRVDLFNINNIIYFGELTVYPENGFGIFKPSEYDKIFGEYWELDK